MNAKSIAFAVLLILGAAACQNDETNLDLVGPLPNDPVFLELPIQANSNARLSGSEYQVELYMAEYITSGEGDEIGRTVYFSNRGNKQLGADWAPGDPRRGESNDISYFVDLVDGPTTSGLSAAQTTTAINNAMGTWDAVNCSKGLNIVNKGAIPVDLGYVQNLFGFGGLPFFLNDITHGGFLPGLFFDAVAPPNGGTFILGATFTFVWLDGSGNYTDIDNNNKLDVAFREIYYNDNFSWAVDRSTFDVETVALHEAGHGLSQAHFGEAFRSGGNNKLHFNPRAVMNATYSGAQTQIQKTDKAGHCSNWAQWPKN